MVTHPELSQFSWLIPALPFGAFVLVGLFPQFGRRGGAALAIVATGLSFLASLITAVRYWSSFGSNYGKAIVPIRFDWLVFSGASSHSAGLVADVGILLDPSSLLLALVVTSVSLLVQIYSIGYLAGHKGFRRFFCFMSLFTGAMLGLVLSSSLLQLFVFWELVGLGSFLLIGFYYERPAAVVACKKAFVVTRFADLGFLLGLLILVFHCGTFDILEIVDQSESLPYGTALAAGLLIAIGAFGKSAMFPLHIWLPDAMEGPSPVSALIHAATMVVAGVYLIARLMGFYLFAFGALPMIAAVGCFTALFAALIACTQSDLKRVLAYSTLSQIGYMMLAIGVTNFGSYEGFAAAHFHLYTHAFFKALLFLAAGTVIHAVHTNDIWKMGGLRKQMPITHWVFLVGSLALAAFPPFAVSGFFSKEAILHALLENHMPLLVISIVVSGLTAYYIARVYLLVFWGNPSDCQTEVRDPARVMLIPMAILALLSIGSGWAPFASYGFIPSVEQAEPHVAWELIAASSVVVLFGFWGAFVLYGRERGSIQVPRWGTSIYEWVANKFYVDEVYQFLTERIILRGVAEPLTKFDRRVVDGAVDLSGRGTVGLGGLLRWVSSGQLSGHLIAIVLGLVVILVAVIFA